MANSDASIDGAASTEVGGMSEIGRERIWSKAKRQRRRTQRNLQPHNLTEAADHGETGGHDSGGTLREPPHPLGSGW